MTATDSSQPVSLSDLSDQLADRIASAEQAIVAVNGSQRCGASGIYWQSGVIVTVDHAVQREEEISIRLADQRTVTATVVGRDSSTDLAVLQIQPIEVSPLQPSSTPLRIGHLVLALGRASEGDLNASMGIVGRLGGSWQTWQGGQIDQWIRPSLMSSFGQTGGALLDSAGQLIGMNTAGPRHTTLTIPVATIQRVVNQLLQTGRIARGYLGVGMQPVPISERLVQSLNLDQSAGVMILSVEPDSPADQAGVLIGDVLIALDAQPITDVSDVRLMLTSDRVGQAVTARVIRGGTILEQVIQVGEREVQDPEPEPEPERRRGRGRGRGGWERGRR